MQIATGVGGYEGFSYMQPPSSQQSALVVEAPEGAPLPDPGGNLQVTNLLCLHVTHSNDSVRQPPLCILRTYVLCVCVCVCVCVYACFKGSRVVAGTC